MSRLSKLLRGGRRKAGSAGAHAPSWFETRRQPSPTVGTAAELYAQPHQREASAGQFGDLLAAPATLDAIARDKVPMPATIDREGYFDDYHLSYWLSGLQDFQMVRRLAPDASLAHVLDFGGATGRFARHVVLADEAAHVTLTDLNVNHVEWVDNNFGPSVRAVKVSPYPYFPLADASVTLCVGFSVFTHIDSYETGWLAEINRVLVDGGHAILTIHSEETWPLIESRPLLFNGLMKDPRFVAGYRPGQKMPAGRTVYDISPNSIEHNCNVFMDEAFVRSRWGRWFDVVDIAHRAHHGFQAAVILRKRAR